MTDLDTTLTTLAAEDAEKRRKQIEGLHVEQVGATRRLAELTAVHDTTLRAHGVADALANTLTLQFHASLLDGGCEEDD